MVTVECVFYLAYVFLLWCAGADGPDLRGLQPGQGRIRWAGDAGELLSKDIKSTYEDGKE